MGKPRTTRVVKLIAIGHSKAIVLPKVLLQRHGWSGTLVLEEREDGVFLYSKQKNRFSWEETYGAMAAEQEDWSDLDATVADGVALWRRFPDVVMPLEAVPSPAVKSSQLI